MDSYLVQVLLPGLKEFEQSCHNLFCPLNTEKERTLLARGEETTTPQAIKASNYRVLGIHVHQENTQFSTDQLMECQFQMREVTQKLVSTPLFSF